MTKKGFVHFKVSFDSWRSRCHFVDCRCFEKGTSTHTPPNPRKEGQSKV